MPMSCLLLNEFVGGAIIDAAIPAIYSSLLVCGALLFSISLVALLISVIVVLVSTNYWAFVYRPASLAHSRRKRKLRMIAADREFIKFNGTAAAASRRSSHSRARYHSEPMSAYCVRVFHIVKRSLQYGITVLSYRGKREKIYVAAQSVWCGMNRPSLLFTSTGDPRTLPSSSSAPSPSSPPKSAPFLSPSRTPYSPPPPPFSPFTPASPQSAFSKSPSRSFRNLYSRKSKSPGLAAVPVCVRKMLIISTDALVQEREKERKRKQRDSGNGRGGRGIIGGRGGGGEGGEGRGMRGLVRGRGGVQLSRQFSSIRSIGDELVVTRTGLADTSRRIVAPRIMFYSRQVLTLMRSRLSQYEHDESGRSRSNISAHKKIYPMSSNEDSFPESRFTVEFRRILEDFHPDGMTLSDEAKEESCELFDIWKGEYFEFCLASGRIQTEKEDRMINFKLFEDWFSHDFMCTIHSNLSDRIFENIARSPVLAVTIKKKELDQESAHSTTNAVSWYAPPPAREKRTLGDLIRDEEKDENRI